MSIVVFRVDSSIRIGSGHVMRCLTLAKQLNSKYEVVFISRDLSGNLNEFVQQNSFKLFELPKSNSAHVFAGYEEWLTVTQYEDAQQTIDILKKYSGIAAIVVDSYAIDEKWENLIRPYVQKIMVIDDLANRKHNCDILLDQNYYINMNTRYNGFVNDNCKLLLGPTYALLRDEFYIEKKKQRHRDGTIKNILVFFGGSDLTNETMKALSALVLLDRKDISVNVVVGASNQYKDEVKEFCYKYRWMNYYCQINNMAEMMNQADLSIGAGGTTTWERCFLGLPAIVIAVAENQVKIAEACAQKECIKYIGRSTEVDVDIILRELEIIVKYYDDILKNFNNIKFEVIQIGKIIL